MQNITIFGATGSIGDSTLDIVRRHPDRFRIYALSAQRRMKKLAELARQRYQVGMSPQMETLGLQAAALSAQDALYANYAARRLQEARLANSLGIGFSDAVHPSERNTGATE